MQEQYKILVVEDDEIWQKKFQIILEAEGYFVQSASNYQEAKSALEEQPFHLAVVDLSLVPGAPSDRAGLQLLDEELNKYEGLGAVVVTAYGTLEETSEYVRKRKAYTFIGKADFDTERFREAVKTAIASAITGKRVDETLERIVKKEEARRKRVREREGD